MSWVEALGYVGAIITICTYSMKTMIPLRAVGICANIVFIVYGISGQLYPAIFLHAILLPLNCVRLYQMLQLTKKVRVASQGDLNMDWLKPFMNRRRVREGEVLFKKGEIASAMFYTVTGSYRLAEIDMAVPPGQVVGEIGLIAPDSKRTLTFECTGDGELLTISYSQVKQLYYQNPSFGFFFLQLISQRLFQDIARLEQRAAKAV
jgi:CRP/FNR family transcriptional regulator, cyclic AMP receptor protein